MLTNSKDREDHMMLLTEREAETDAHRYEGLWRLHSKDREDHMMLLSEQEAETDAH